MNLCERIRETVVVTEAGCWEWQGSRLPKGYGMLWVGSRPSRRKMYAHRAAYEAFVGPIPDGLQIDHLCRNTSCCNPEHLEPVTARENLLRGDTITARAAAATHCPKGHPYDEANTYVRSADHRAGHRDCRACMRERNRRRPPRNKHRKAPAPLPRPGARVTGGKSR